MGDSDLAQIIVQRLLSLNFRIMVNSNMVYSRIIPDRLPSMMPNNQTQIELSSLEDCLRNSDMMILAVGTPPSSSLDEPSGEERAVVSPRRGLLRQDSSRKSGVRHDVGGLHGVCTHPRSSSERRMRRRWRRSTTCGTSTRHCFPFRRRCSRMS